MKLEAGYHPDVPMDDYVADRLRDDVTVSKGIIKTIWEQTPKHARLKHPRFGVGEHVNSNRSDIGSAVHSLILGGQKIEYVESVTMKGGKNKGETVVPKDWTTADSQEQRAAIYERGNIPMLPHQREIIEAAAQAGRDALKEYGPGKTEVTMLWQDVGGVWCRGRADYLTDDGKYDIDIKTCDSANPSTWIRSVLVGGGYDIQAALRVRGHEKISERTRDVLFLLVEIEPPFATSIIGVGPALAEMAGKKIEYALKIWKECLTTNKWPAYSPEIHYAEPPGFMAYDLAAKGIDPT